MSKLYCWLPTVEIWRIWNFYSNKFYPWHRSIFHVENLQNFFRNNNCLRFLPQLLECGKALECGASLNLGACASRVTNRAIDIFGGSQSSESYLVVKHTAGPLRRHLTHAKCSHKCAEETIFTCKRPPIPGPGPVFCKSEFHM